MYHECEKAQMRWFMWTETISESGSGKAWKTKHIILSAACFRVCPNGKKAFHISMTLVKEKKKWCKKAFKEFYFQPVQFITGIVQLTGSAGNFFSYLLILFVPRWRKNFLISLFHKIKLFLAHFFHGHFSFVIWLREGHRNGIWIRKFGRHVHGEKSRK